jgi:hypothetical protein
MKDLIGMLPSAVPIITLKLTFTLNFLVILKSVAKPVKNVKSLLLVWYPSFKEIPHGAAIINRSGVMVFLPTVMGYMAKLIIEGDRLIDPP